MYPRTSRPKLAIARHMLAKNVSDSCSGPRYAGHPDTQQQRTASRTTNCVAPTARSEKQHYPKDATRSVIAQHAVRRVPASQRTKHTRQKHSVHKRREILCSPCGEILQHGIDAISSHCWTWRTTDRPCQATIDCTAQGYSLAQPHVVSSAPQRSDKPRLPSASCLAACPNIASVGNSGNMKHNRA